MVRYVLMVFSAWLCFGCGAASYEYRVGPLSNGDYIAILRVTTPAEAERLCGPSAGGCARLQSGPGPYGTYEAARVVIGSTDPETVSAAIAAHELCHIAAKLNVLAQWLVWDPCHDAKDGQFAPKPVRVR